MPPCRISLFSLSCLFAGVLTFVAHLRSGGLKLAPFLDFKKVRRVGGSPESFLEDFEKIAVFFVFFI